jgi:hypothetical protein
MSFRVIPVIFEGTKIAFLSELTKFPAQSLFLEAPQKKSKKIAIFDYVFEAVRNY